MNKKIVFFLPSLEGGGAEKNVINLINGLYGGEFKVNLILAERKGRLLDEVPKDCIIDLNARSLWKIIYKMVVYFRKDTPDIFISTFPRYDFANLLAKFISGRSFLFWVVIQTIPSEIHITAKNFLHKIIASLFLPALMSFFYNRTDTIVCVSHSAKQDLSKFIKINESKIKIIYNPVVGKIIFDKSKEKVEHPWFNGKDKPLILSAGRIVPTKDYKTLLESFKKLLDKIEARLVILGEGSEVKRMIEYAKKLGVSSSVDFIGFQKNPYKFIGRCDIFVLSSVREGFSNVLVEAMALGVPVVSTDCEGPKEIIKNEDSGILVPKKSAFKMAEAIYRILNDNGLAKNISSAGQKGSECFTIEKSVNEYKNLFKQSLYE